MAHPPRLKSHFLEPGDTIGIVAPASPFDSDAFEEGIAVLHSMGFTTKVGAGVFERRGYLAGKDSQRVNQLHAMLVDDQVQAIVCARGGYGTMRLLPYLDYELCREHVKPFIGFSDITALHLSLQANAGWVTFHGPMVTTLAQCDDLSRQAFYDTLSGQNRDYCDLTQARWLQSGSAQGRLIGGNLATLCHLVGTPFAGNFDGAILLLEDTGEALYRIDRMLIQMRLARAFDGLAGVVLGDFENCGAADDLDSLMQSHFGSMGIPVVAWSGVGHGERNLTLPLGINVRLDADNANLAFLEKAFDE